MSRTYETERFKVGDRVAVVSHTNTNLGPGYIREILDGRGYLIYWTRIGDVGSGWDDTDLAPA